MYENIFNGMSKINQSLRDRIISEGYTIPECVELIRERIKQLEGKEFNPPETKIQEICKHWPFLGIGETPNGKRFMVFGKTIKAIEQEMTVKEISVYSMIRLCDLRNCEYGVEK